MVKVDRHSKEKKHNTWKLSIERGIFDALVRQEENMRYFDSDLRIVRVCTRLWFGSLQSLRLCSFLAINLLHRCLNLHLQHIVSTRHA